jgi:hypothetical protein
VLEECPVIMGICTNKTGFFNPHFNKLIPIIINKIANRQRYFLALKT